jgi:putative exosortase-associated protein (TIGR04073 family)
MRQVLSSFVVAATLLLSSSTRADETPASEAPQAVEPVPVPVPIEATPDEEPEPVKKEGINVFKAMRKGGRGITNIATSPLEIPNQMVREAKRHNTFTGQVGGYLTGIPVGCGWMLYRCGTGLFDLVTFAFPIPTYDKSYIQPEFLFPTEPYLDGELK